MKAHKKSIKKSLSLLVLIIFASIVLTSPFWGFAGLMFLAEKSDENSHRKYMLSVELVKTAQMLDNYKNKNQTYPTTLSQAKLSENICANYADREVCTRMVYKPNKELTDFKLAAENGNDIVFAQPGAIIPSVADNKNKLNNKLFRNPDNDFLYLQKSKIFTNPTEWPTYEELAKR